MYHQLFDILKGGLTSPSLFKNSVLQAQNSVNFSCIHRGVNLSLMTFADDVLNLSRTFSGCENAFNQFYNEYNNIGLSFNVEKTAVVAFNFKETNDPIFLSLANVQVPLFQKFSLPWNAYWKKYERNCEIIL